MHYMKNIRIFFTKKADGVQMNSMNISRSQKVIVKCFKLNKDQHFNQRSIRVYDNFAH